MSVYLTPGTYLRPQPAERKDVRLVRTDVAGFVGFTERGPLSATNMVLGSKIKAEDLAIRLTSWKEFTAIFGGFIPFGSLAYAVRAFFDNGGTTCYVVRVAAINGKEILDHPRPAKMALPGGAPSPAGRLAQAVGKGENKLVLDAGHKLAEGSLVAIAGEGVIEFSMVIGKDDTSVILGSNTKSAFSAGDVVFQYPPDPPALVVKAVSAGNWGNRVRLDITPLQDSSLFNEFSLRVTVDPGFYVSESKQEEIYNRLTLNRDDKANERLYAPNVINQHSQLIRLDVPIDVPQPNLFIGEKFASDLTAGPLKSGPFYLQGGRDGLKGISALDFTGGSDQFWGLRILEEIDEVAILCAPDAVFEAPPVVPRKPSPPQHPCDPPPKDDKPDPLAEDPTAIPSVLDESDVFNIYQIMLDQCERLRDRVAILDPPSGQNPKQVVIWRNKFNSRFGALYYPWLKVPDSTNANGKTRLVPPSGHVAGVYARIDNQFGVHHPPANAALEFVTDVADEITAIQQEELNPFSVNAIRPFNGRGIRVWGARSVAERNDSDWKFIHARRLMSMIEESVYKSMQWAVFEPNDYSLRRTLVHSLSVFLEQIWRQGGLKGALPAEAFYVKCDETNNPPSVVDAGQIVCQVGVAVAAPMEFIIFEIRRGPSDTQVTEPED
jgi:hypothetical protein